MLWRITVVMSIASALGRVDRVRTQRHTAQISAHLMHTKQCGAIGYVDTRLNWSEVIAPGLPDAIRCDPFDKPTHLSRLAAFRSRICRRFKRADLDKQIAALRI